MTVLILSYACEPYGASEYGVGWNVPVTMAKNYPDLDIYVVTRSKHRSAIDEALKPMFQDGNFKSDATESSSNNLHFLFYDLPKYLKWRNEERTHWGEQVNYVLWQLKVRSFIQQYQKRSGINFDIVHHLTYNQYRTPSPGYWMKIPFVVGPIGGGECVNPVFYADLQSHTLHKERIRRAGHDLRVFRWFNKRRKNKKLILCSSRENYLRLKPFCGNSDIALMSAIGFENLNFNPNLNSNPNPNLNLNWGGEDGFTMICPCKAWDWKGIHFFLRAVKQMQQKVDGKALKVLLVGVRFEEEKERVMGWCRNLGLEKVVELLPFMEREKLLELEKGSDLVVYPAFRDSGSMAVLEACALARPVICFNAGGQDVFPDDVIIKVPVSTTYEATLNSFVDKLLWAYNHPSELISIAHKAQSWATNNMTWDHKVHHFVEIYNKMLSC